MCGKKYGLFLNPFLCSFLVFLLLCTTFSTSEETKIYLTESEYTELMLLLETSETSRILSEKELREVSLTLSAVTTNLLESLDDQKQMDGEFSELKTSWNGRKKEVAVLENSNAFYKMVIKYETIASVLLIVGAFAVGYFM